MERVPVRCVAVVVDETSDYQRRLLHGLDEELALHGVRLLTVVSDPRDCRDGDLLSGLIAAGVVQGVVITLLRSAETERAVAASARSAGVPMVTIARRIPNAVNVECGNRPGMESLMAHVFDGRDVRHPVFVSGDPESVDGRVREAVFREACAARGVVVDEELVLPGEFRYECAFRAVAAALVSHPQIDAVIAANDEMASGALEALTMAGRRVPHDVVLTGFDDEDIARRYDITSVAQDIAGQGRAAARILLGHGTDGDVVIGSSLVARGSTGSLPRRSRLSADVVDEASSFDTALEASRAFAACADLDDVAAAMAAHLPRLGVRRCWIALRSVWNGVETSYVALSVIDGQAVTGRCEPPWTVTDAQLLPAGMEDQLPRSCVVQMLFGPQRWHGYLVYEMRGESTHPRASEVLQLDLSRTFEALARETELQSYAAELERMVALRTAQLEAEVTTRRAAEAQLRTLNVELERINLVDELTGAANRRAFNAALERMWSRATRAQTSIAVLMADVDRFKPYNDRYGHLAGDACLQAVARTVMGGVRNADDLAARYGGEEFVLLLPGIGEADVRAAARRLVRQVHALGLEHLDGVADGVVTISVGWAVHWPVPGDDPQRLVQCADEALYKAKRAGRNRALTGASL